VDLAWRAHPEVWLLVGGLAGAYWYGVTRIGRRIGESVSRRQVACFAAAVLVLWASSDWPVHDVAESRLYSVHMLQHLFLTLVMPALFLLGTPEWLARLVVGGRGSRSYAVVRSVTRPVVATLLFNGMVVLSHWPVVVNASVDVGLLHYSIHLILVTTALIMWMPVCGPLPELRLSRPGQMIYLFAQSIIPTVPAAWLTFADGAVYSSYDHAHRMWDLSVGDDQQMAGLIMKVVGGFYLWGIITVKFFRWVSVERDHVPGSRPRPAAAPVEEPELTWAEVERELAQAGPAPREP
jgi:putative membrane protein